jgi:flagellar hook-associated protein 3 FlgL
MIGSQAYNAIETFITAAPPNGMGRTLAGINAEFGTNLTIEALTTLNRMRDDVLTFDVGPGIEMPVTFNGIDMVLFTTTDENNVPIIRNAHSVLTDLYDTMMDPNKGAADLTKIIRPMQDAQNSMLMKTAEVGGRSRRLELLEARYAQDQVNHRQMLSDAEDVDMAQVIMELRMAEAVMQASMAAGSRIIQPTLMDFLR